MKRLIILISILFSATAMENSYAEIPTEANLYNVCVPSFCRRITFGIMGIDWEFANPHLDYALAYPEVDSLGNPILEDGKYLNSRPNSSWSYKVNIGYIFPCTGNDVILTYTDYHQKSSDFATRKKSHIQAILPSLSNEWPTFGELTIQNPALVSPVTVFVPAVPNSGNLIPNPTEPNSATEQININYTALDIDFGQYFNVGSCTRLRWFGGIRLVKLTSQLDATYRFNGIALNQTVINGIVTDSSITVNPTTSLTEVVNQNSDYRGLGPHFGLDLNHYLRWGFGIVGNISTSMLAGRIDTSFREHFIKLTSATVTESTINEIKVGTVFSSLEETSSDFRQSRSRRVVPNVDAKIGLDYSYRFCNSNRTKLTLEAGYMVSYYFDCLDRDSKVAVDNPEIRTRHTMATQFDGFYIAVQFNI